MMRPLLAAALLSLTALPRAARILLLTLGLVVAALPNVVPVPGRGIDIAIVLPGLGAIAARLPERLSGRPGAAIAPPPARGDGRRAF